jgi:hypothetical protein
MTNKKAEPASPAESKTPYQKESRMILPDRSPERAEIVLLFRTDVAEEAEALHAFRAAFGAATDIEAVTQDLFALHIRPGVCACGEAA